MRTRPHLVRGARLTMLLAVALVCAPAFAQGESLSETFDDAALPGWERPPEVTVVEGRLHVPQGGFAAHFGDWSEGVLGLKLNLAPGTQAVVEYASRDSGAYRLFISLEELILERVSGESSSLLGAGRASGLTADSWAEIEVTWSGGEHRVSLDGSEVLRAADPEPLAGGGITLRAVGNAAVEFDDLSLESGTAAPPAEGGAVPPPGEGAAAPPPGEAPAGGPGPAEATPPSMPTATPAPGGLAGLIGQLSGQRSDPLQLSTVAVNLALAALFAFILGQAYIYWGASLSNRRAFAANFLLITVTTTFIILVVRSSVALSLGLVGALSIVRFRAAIKEPEELAYLFFAIGIGIGLGDNQRLLTTLALIAGLILVGLMHIFRRGTADVNLHLTIAGSGEAHLDLERLMQTLQQHCTKARLMRFDETGERMEASFLVELRRLDDLQAARAALRQLAPGLEITFLDNRGVG